MLGSGGRAGSFGRAGSKGVIRAGQLRGGARVTPGSGGAALGGKPTATPAGPTGPSVTPFLTPAQSYALTKWNDSFGREMQALNLADTKAFTTYGIDTAKYKEAATANDFKENDTAAGRGLFQSSIRTNAMNDIAGTLAMNDNIASTNLHAALANDQNTRGYEQGINEATQLYYSGIAVNNAQASDLAAPPATPAPGPAAHPGAAAHPTVTRPPVVVSSRPEPTSVGHAGQRGVSVASPKVGMLGTGGRATSGVASTAHAAPRVPGAGGSRGAMARGANMRIGAPV